VLPSGNLFQNQQTYLVAGIEKMTRLGIVRSANNVAPQAVAQNHRILPLHATRHRLADPWKRLMAVETAEFDDGSIEGESLRRETRLAKPDATHVVVDYLRAAKQTNFNAV